MSGERDLQRLLANVSPILDDRRWMFARLAPGEEPDPSIEALMSFREDEGWTLIVEESDARALAGGSEGPYRRITCAVHSSLEAVGFLAAIANALAKEGIPCNAVSAFHHDHLFLPHDLADRAMEVLRGVGARSDS